MEREDPEEVLKRHFKIKKLDKYSRAVMRLVIEKHFAKEMKGKKNKVSRRMIFRINKGIINELQQRYDKHVFFSGFDYKKVKNRNSDLGNVSDSVDFIYKTKHGRIYFGGGHSFQRVYFTSHSLNRFEERLETEEQQLLNMYIKKYDLTVFQFLISCFSNVKSYYVRNDTLFLCCIVKNIEAELILVMKKLDDIFLLKTVLTSNMWKERNSILYNKLVKLEQKKEDMTEYFLDEFSNK